jgi:hypothetical protein
MQRPADDGIPLTLANKGAELLPFHVNLEHTSKKAVGMKLLVKGNQVHRNGHRLLILAIDDGGNTAGSAGRTCSSLPSRLTPFGGKGDDFRHSCFSRSFEDCLDPLGGSEAFDGLIS